MFQWIQSLFGKFFKPSSRATAPPTSASIPEMTQWFTQIQSAINRGEIASIETTCSQMYDAMLAKYGTPFYPVLLELHQTLSKFFLDLADGQDALREVNYALQLSPSDSILLVRKCLILIQLKEYSQAQALITQVVHDDPSREQDPQVAGMIGRTYRELWEQNPKTIDNLNQAIKAYKSASDAYPDEFFPAINYAELSLAYFKLTNPANAEQLTAPLFNEVLQRCQKEQDRGGNSYWLFFTRAQAQLALRSDINLIKQSYQKGNDRNPPYRDWISAMDGLDRTIKLLGYDPNIAKEIRDQRG